MGVTMPLFSQRISALVLSAAGILPGPTVFAHVEKTDPVVINWSNCKQPDLASDAHQKAVKQSIDKYLNEAKAKYPSDHIAVKLNKIYGAAVQDRRDLVQLNYIPIGVSRTEKQCALSAENYQRLIVLRDASYYILCRSEVGVGSSATRRIAMDLTTLATAAIYDLVKSIGADLRAKKNEPTTPPGGYAACKAGAAAASTDPIPNAASTRSFRSRLSLSAEEVAGIGDPSKQ
jgi:hypothetical protein